MWDNTELLAGSKADNFEFTRDRNVINIQTKSVCTAEDWVEIPILYYKGYTARSLESGEKMVVSAGTGNRVRVMIPQGYSGNIQVKFEEPWYWKISELISILGGMIMLYFRERTQKKLKRQKNRRILW